MQIWFLSRFMPLLLVTLGGLILHGGSFCFAQQSTAKSVELETVGSDRVTAIASMLDKSPIGVGMPITNRAAWDKWSQRSALRAAIVSEAERQLEQATPEVTDADFLEYSKNGSRSTYQDKTNRRRYRLSLWVQAECLENRGRFLPAIEKEIKAICSEKTWVLPAHDKTLANFKGTKMEMDLWVAMTAWSLATADWLLGDQLTSETRKLIRDEARKRVFTPQLEEIRGKVPQEWWSTSTFNWNPVVYAGLTGSALALIDSAVERAEFVDYAERNVKSYLKGFTSDGYAEEGLSYWNYGFGHFVLLAETLFEATHGGVNLYADERARLVAQYPKRVEILPNTYPAFADCLTITRPALWTLSILNDRYGFKWNIGEKSPPLNPMYGPLLYAVAINFFPASSRITPVLAGSTEKENPLRHWFSHAQVLVARPSATENTGLGLSFKGGTNGESHGHLDVGTFVVVKGRESLIVDPGSVVYSAATFDSRRFENRILNSYGHAVPVVAGQFQKEGSSHRAIVMDQSFTDKKDSVTLDLTKAYAVPSLKQLTRRFDYDRTGVSAITITDTVTFDSPGTFGSALITLGTVQEVNATTFLIYRNHECIQVEIDTEGLSFTTKDEVIPERLASGTVKARRFGIYLKDPVSQATLKMRITPATSPEPDFSREEAATIEAHKPDMAKAITIKAAEFTRQTGGNAVPSVKIGSSGAGIRLWKSPGHTLTWKFTVPTTGDYALQVRYCRDAEKDLQSSVQIDGAPVPNSKSLLVLPSTNGWSEEADDWAVSWLAQDKRPVIVTLSAGSHEVTLINQSEDGASLDWLKLIPLSAAP